MPETPLVVEWQRVTHRLLHALDAALGDLGRRLPGGARELLAAVDRAV